MLRGVIVRLHHGDFPQDPLEFAAVDLGWVRQTAGMLSVSRDDPCGAVAFGEDCGAMGRPWWFATSGLWVCESTGELCDVFASGTRCCSGDYTMHHRVELPRTGWLQSSSWADRATGLLATGGYYVWTRESMSVWSEVATPIR